MIDTRTRAAAMLAVEVSLPIPDLALWIPGPVVPRPNGIPWHYRSYQSLARRAELYELAGTKPPPKLRARLAKAKGWERWFNFRTRVRAAVELAKARRFTGPVFGTAVFHLERPRNHFRADGTLKPGAPEIVAVRPDTKNLRYALEDALNPRKADAQGLGSWHGLWPDDSMVELFPVRAYAGPRGPGAELKLWGVKILETSKEE